VRGLGAVIKLDLREERGERILLMVVLRAVSELWVFACSGSNGRRRGGDAHRGRVVPGWFGFSRGGTVCEWGSAGVVMQGPVKPGEDPCIQR
jgi:hypothetical protein